MRYLGDINVEYLEGIKATRDGKAPATIRTFHLTQVGIQGIMWNRSSIELLL